MKDRSNAPVLKYIKNGPYYHDNMPTQCILASAHEYHDMVASNSSYTHIESNMTSISCNNDSVTISKPTKVIKIHSNGEVEIIKY